MILLTKVLLRGVDHCLRSYRGRLVIGGGSGLRPSPPARRRSGAAALRRGRSRRQVSAFGLKDPGVVTAELLKREPPVVVLKARVLKGPPVLGGAGSQQPYGVRVTARASGRVRAGCRAGKLIQFPVELVPLRLLARLRLLTTIVTA